MREYYKVVEKLNNKYVSAVNTPLRLKYEIGEWTYPYPDTSLMCFNDINDAITFIKQGYGSYIFTCEVKYPSKYGVFVSQVFSSNFIDMVKKVIKVKKLKKKYYKQMMAINGSNFFTAPSLAQSVIFCKALKLKECVYEIS